MVSGTARTRMVSALGVIVLLLSGLAGSGVVQDAHGYPDGQYPRSALVQISGGGSSPNRYLTPGPGADWNLMANCAARAGVELYPAGAASAYRERGVPSDWPPPVYGTQWYFWGAHIYARGPPAAVPGTSNHGAPGGRGAIDLGSPATMRPYIDRHGREFGWTWGEITSENWHVTHWSASSVTGIPDPGPSQRFPVLRTGSRGRCLAPAVNELQRRLGVKQSGSFGDGTRRVLKEWQRDHICKKCGSGIVGHTTWIAIRGQRAVPHPNYVRLTKPVRMRGKDVLAVQGKLNARRHEIHKPPVKADGVWGTADNAALKNFQRAHHLDDSGVAGPKTLKALRTPAKKVQAVTKKIAAKAPAEEARQHKVAKHPCAYRSQIKRAACVTRVARTTYLRRDAYAKKQHGAKRAEALKARKSARSSYIKAKVRLRSIPTRITWNGTRFIAEFEGGQAPDGRFYPYRDPVGVWTIGYGHTEGVSARSRSLNQSEALALLQRDLNVKYTPPVVNVLANQPRKWNHNELDCDVSFVYNLGTGTLGTGYTWGRAIRRGDFTGAANAMLLYDKAGGRPLPGLTRRRHAERALCLR